MSGEITDMGVELVRFLILGTLGAAVLVVLWDFVRGLARG